MSIKNTGQNDLVRFLQNLYRLSLKYSYFIIGIFCLMSFYSIVSFSKLDLELDIYDSRYEKFQSSKNWYTQRDHFSDPNSLYIKLDFDQSMDSKFFCEWQEKLEKIKNQNEDISRVFSLFHLRSPKETKEALIYPKVVSDPCHSKFLMMDQLSEHYYSPLIISKDKKSFLTEISFTEGDDGKIDINFVQKIASEISYFLGKNNFSLLGPLSYRVEFKKIMEKDSVVNLFLLIFIAIFFKLFLGTWLSGLYFILITMVTLLAIFATYSFFNYPIDLLTNNLILLTIIAGTADFIFLSYTLFEKDLDSSFLANITPCFFTTFTTMVGFFSLVSSDLDMIARFGIVAGVAAFFEWVSCFIFLPAFLKVFKLNMKWVDPTKAFKSNHFFKITEFRLPLSIARLILFISMFSIVAWTQFNYSDSPRNNFPTNHGLFKAITSFTENFGWEGNVSLLFNSEIENDQMDRIIEKIKSNTEVFFVEDKKSFLSSWTKNLSSDLRKDLVRREFEMMPLNKRYESRDYKRAIIYLKNQDTKTLEKIKNEVETICQENCFLSGQSLVYLEFNKRISKTLVESFIISIILVILIVIWLKYLFKLTELNILTVIVSSLTGPLIMVVMIALLQVPINIVSSIFFAVLVGLTGDNGIHYMFASKDKKGIDSGMSEKAVPSFVFSIFLIFGSMFLFMQTLVPLKWLGLLFTVGFLVNFIGDYWILKSLNDKSR